MGASGASGRFVPIMIGTQAIDVCALACTSSWARTFEAEPVATFLADEPAVIQAGVRAMSSRNLAICIIMRNRVDLVPGMRQSIEQKLARLFNSTHVIVIENDSEDALRNALASWKHSVELRMKSERNQSGKVVGVHVNSYRFNAPSSTPGDIGGARFHLLGVLRNECLLEVQDSGADILINMDVDHDLQHGWEGFDANGLAHSFGLKGNKETAWDVACANGMINAVPNTEPNSHHQFTTYGGRQSFRGGAPLPLPLAGLLVPDGKSFNSEQPWGVRFNICEQRPCAATLAQSCVAIPPDNQTKCIMWRATRACKASNARDDLQDKVCDSPIGPMQSGYCECSEKRAVRFDCSQPRPFFTCRNVCRNWIIVGKSVTAEMCGPTVFVALAPCGGRLQEPNPDVDIYYNLSLVPPDFSDPQVSCTKYTHKLRGNSIQLNRNVLGALDKRTPFYITSCIRPRHGTELQTLSVQSHNITLDSTRCPGLNELPLAQDETPNGYRFGKKNAVSNNKGMLAVMKRMQMMPAFWGIAYNVCHNADCKPKHEDSCETPLLGQAMECIKWQATADCAPDTQVQGLGRGCDIEVGGFQSGFCVCGEGRVVKFACSPSRAPFTCNQACGNALTMGSSFTVDVKFQSSVFLALGPCGGYSATKYDLFYRSSSEAPASSQVHEEAAKYGCTNFPNKYDGPIKLYTNHSRVVFITSCIQVVAPETYYLSTRPSIIQTHRVTLNCPLPTLPEFVAPWMFYDSLAFRDEAFSKWNWHTHQGLAHLPHDKPIFASSCFGGLAVHDLQGAGDWRRCSYAAHSDNDCEHVSFYACLRQNLNLKIILNPRMWLKYERSTDVST